MTQFRITYKVRITNLSGNVLREVSRGKTYQECGLSHPIGWSPELEEKGEGESLMSRSLHHFCFLKCPNVSKLLLAQLQVNSTITLFLC